MARDASLSAEWGPSPLCRNSALSGFVCCQPAERVLAHRQGPASPLSPSDKKAEIDTLAAEYIASVRALSAEQRVAHLQRIQSAYSRCKEYSDDKVQLAMQTYEMVRLLAGGVRAGSAHRASDGGRPSRGGAACRRCLCARLGGPSVYSTFICILILFGQL